MLVVNAAVAARRAGHDVVIYTSHHDESRCFKETTAQGMLRRHAASRRGAEGCHAWCLSQPRQRMFRVLDSFCYFFRGLASGACSHSSPRAPHTFCFMCAEGGGATAVGEPASEVKARHYPANLDGPALFGAILF